MVSFYEEAITPDCRQALATLRSLSVMRAFYLAGGTGLALQLGHRLSTDLDWFSASNPLTELEREALLRNLQEAAEFELVSEQDGVLIGRMEGADVSFLYQPHTLLEPVLDFRGLQLASPTDIGLLKLAAINSRGTRRDFVDLYCLREVAPLERLFELAEIKYADRPSFLTISVRALTYFADAEQQPMPRMYQATSWEDVRRYCEEAAQRLARRLSGLGDSS